MEKFDATDELKSVAAEAVTGAREAKILFMEWVLLKQLSTLASDPSEKAADDMKALVTKQQMFCTSNRLNITSADLHAGLWTEAQAKSGLASVAS